MRCLADFQPDNPLLRPPAKKIRRCEFNLDGNDYHRESLTGWILILRTGYSQRRTSLGDCLWGMYFWIPFSIRSKSKSVSTLYIRIILLDTFSNVHSCMRCRTFLFFNDLSIRSFEKYSCFMANLLSPRSVYSTVVRT